MSIQPPPSEPTDASDWNTTPRVASLPSLNEALAPVETGFLLHDLEGRILTADQGARNLLGYTWPEMAQINRALFDPSFASRDIPKERNGLPHWTDVTSEKQFLRKDGTPLMTSVREGLFTLGDRTVVSLAFEDRREWEQSLASHKRLQEHLKNILQLMPDLLVRIQEDGTILELITPTQPAFLAQPARYCVGRNVRDVFLGVAVWKIMDFWNIAHETRRLQSFDFKYNLGKSVFYYETRALMLGEDEALYIIRDVTTRKAAEEKVSDLLTQARSDNEELRRLGKVKDDFLSALSNELRNPMTTVLGYLRLLKDNSLGPLTPAQAESLSVALQNGIRLRDLLNKLLDLAQSKQGKLNLIKTPSALNYLVGNAIENVRLEAEKKGLQIQRFQPPGPIEILLDPEQMERVLTNLLENAVRFSPEKGDLEIGWGIQNDKEGMAAFFWVRDHGPGVPFADLERIFEPFSMVQNPEIEVAGGSGASLALCRQITQAHGGRVWAESVEGQGATFRVLLPLQGLEGPP